MTVDETTECSSLISKHSTPWWDVWEHLGTGLAWRGHAPSSCTTAGLSLWYGQHLSTCTEHHSLNTKSPCGCVCVYIYMCFFFFFLNNCPTGILNLLFLSSCTLAVLPFHAQKSFICHNLVTPGIPMSLSFYLTFHPTSHTPHIFIPILFRGRSFQGPALSCTRRMGRWWWGYSAGRC